MDRRRIKWTNIGNSNRNSDDNSKWVIRFGLQDCKKPSAQRHACRFQGLPSSRGTKIPVPYQGGELSKGSKKKGLNSS